MGPLPINQLDLDQQGSDLRSRKAGFQPWQIDDGSIFHWESGDGPSLRPHFDVERVRLTGAWTGWDLDGFYVIRSRIHSSRIQTTRLKRTAGFVTRVILNGVDVTPAGPWNDTPSVRRAITVEPDASTRFFRLRRR